ncbi:MAG: Inositol 2-dehydrogenase [Verrucomicrobiota bacterium]
MSRRRFATGMLSAALAAGVAPAVATGQPASRRVRVGVMGLGRGMDHVTALLEVPGAEVACVCDVDERRRDAAAQRVFGKTGRRPGSVADLRRMLDDREIDAVSIAAPNFWHAVAAVMACRAGKHVYVEKPGSHNAHEGMRLAAIAAETGRLVQLGTQRRSSTSTRQAIEELRSGVIGPVRVARCRYDNARASIGRGKPAPVPSWLDYNLWQGPAPSRPYLDNVVHYQWHWRWHWGGGELANNGPHALDIARWGLGVQFPRRVTANGGRLHFDDDQETPDTLTAHFDFGTAAILWDHSSCHPRKGDAPGFVTFYGDGGLLALEASGSYRVLDASGREVRSVKGGYNDKAHFGNFVDAIRDGAALNAPASDGARSVHLCHLGNIAWRTSGAVDVDPATGHLHGATRAQRRLWSREYRRGWGI